MQLHCMLPGRGTPLPVPSWYLGLLVLSTFHRIQCHLVPSTSSATVFPPSWIRGTSRSTWHVGDLVCQTNRCPPRLLPRPISCVARSLPIELWHLWHLRRTLGIPSACLRYVGVCMPGMMTSNSPPHPPPLPFLLPPTHPLNLLPPLHSLNLPAPPACLSQDGVMRVPLKSRLYVCGQETTSWSSPSSTG